MNMHANPPEAAVPAPALEVKDLRTQFFTDAGVVRAVDGVSFTVGAGETLGIVGESGSGKSITALSLMRLLEEPSRIVGGEIRFQGRDMLRASPEELRNLRGDRLAMVFQDPMTSLNPVLKIARQLVETMVEHGRYTPAEASKRAISLLGRMGVSAPERAVDSYPHQFSGGMRQRVMLAVGMSNEPALLIADEPTTALDVTIQAQILYLLRELNDNFGTAIVLISHDLGVIARVCARTIVMYGGEVVEEGPTDQLLADPRHPYTWALINAVPRIDEATSGDRRLTTIDGQPPDPLNQPTGCRFAPRCPFRIAKCDEHPKLEDVQPGRRARCWVTQSGQKLELRTTRVNGWPQCCGAGSTVAARNAGAQPKRRSCKVRGLVEALRAAQARIFRGAALRSRRRPCRFRRSPRRDRGTGRRIRLRQVDIGSHHRSHPSAGRRRNPVRWPRSGQGHPEGHPAAATTDPDGVSGSLCVAQSAHECRGYSGGTDPLSRIDLEQCRDQHPHRRTARHRRAQSEGGATLSARVFRRTATAHPRLRARWR